MRAPYFRYAAAPAGAPVTRAEAVARLRRAESVMVTLYPGAMSVQVKVTGLARVPEVVTPGWGNLPPSRADRWGRALIEAAAVAAEASEPADNTGDEG